MEGDGERPPAFAVEGADDGLAGVEERGGHDGLERRQAGRVGGAGAPALLPERLLLGPHLFEDALAGPPGSVARRPVAVGGGDAPVVAVEEEDAADFESDDLDEGLGGLVEEVGRADGGLEDAHGGLEPADHLLELRPAESGQRPEAVGEVGEAAGSDGVFFEALEDGLHVGVVADADGASGQGEGERRGDFGGGAGREGASGDGGAGEGGLAAVGEPDAAGGERFEEGVSARDVVHFVLAGDDESGRPGVVGGLEGVRLRLAGLLSSQLDRPGQPALEGRLIGFGDTDCQGIGHGGYG